MENKESYNERIQTELNEIKNNTFELVVLKSKWNLISNFIQRLGYLLYAYCISDKFFNKGLSYMSITIPLILLTLFVEKWAKTLFIEYSLAKPTNLLDYQAFTIDTIRTVMIFSAAITLGLFLSTNAVIEHVFGTTVGNSSLILYFKAFSINMFTNINYRVASVSSEYVSNRWSGIISALLFFVEYFIIIPLSTYVFNVSLNLIPVFFAIIELIGFFVIFFLSEFNIKLSSVFQKFSSQYKSVFIKCLHLLIGSTFDFCAHSLYFYLFSTCYDDEVVSHLASICICQLLLLLCRTIVDSFELPLLYLCKICTIKHAYHMAYRLSRIFIIIGSIWWLFVVPIVIGLKSMLLALWFDIDYAYEIAGLIINPIMYCSWLSTFSISLSTLMCDFDINHTITNYLNPIVFVLYMLYFKFTDPHDERRLSFSYTIRESVVLLLLFTIGMRVFNILWNTKDLQSDEAVLKPKGTKY